MHKSNFNKPFTANERDTHQISIGVRVRLTPDQKALIKHRWAEIECNETNPETTSTRGGLKVTTAQTPSGLVAAMGCDRNVLAALLASEDRLQVPMLMRWEEALGIQLLTREALDAAWLSYLTYMGLVDRFAEPPTPKKTARKKAPVAAAS